MISLFTRMTLLHLLVAAAAGARDDRYEPCPPMPSWEEVDAAEVLADPGVVAALLQVDELLNNASVGLPTGLIATVVLDQSNVWSKGYGRRDAFAPKPSGPPTTENLVRIASITKVFTALLAFEMRDAGEISLDQSLVSLVPNFTVRSNGWDSRAPITLRTLASHTSGLPRETPFPCGTFEWPGCTEAAVLAALAPKAAVSPPHSRFHYSNLGSALLGRALGRALPLPRGVNRSLAYERLLEERVLAPLNMTATFAFDEYTVSRMAVGASSDGQRVAIAPGPSCGFDAPAGCLWASANDLASLMKLFFRTRAAKASGARSQIVDGATLAEALLPAITLRDGSSAVGTPWEFKYSSALWMKSKQGELPGYRSSVTLIEGLRLGIFTSALVSDVPEKSVWTIPALDIVAPAVRAALWRLQPPRALPTGWERLVGRYYTPSDPVVVRADGAALLLTHGADVLNLTLTAIGGVLRAHPASAPADQAGCRWLDDGTDEECVGAVRARAPSRASSLPTHARSNARASHWVFGADPLCSPPVPHLRRPAPRAPLRHHAGISTSTSRRRQVATVTRTRRRLNSWVAATSATRDATNCRGRTPRCARSGLTSRCANDYSAAEGSIQRRAPRRPGPARPLT